LNTFEEVEIFGVKSELSQVILSIISNAIDVLKNIENPKIKILISSNSAEVILV
jgi:C4-dicarboxylate-specific signal transduction histidine kinase